MKRKNILFLGILLVLLVLSFFGCGKNASNNKEIEASENTKADELNLEQEQAEERGVQFPIVLEDEKLEVQSIFQFEGINPDCNNLEGEDIAAISLKNISNDYLKNAVIEATLDDGKKYTFSVDDLPAGKEAMAFVTDNSVLPSDGICMEIKAESHFEEITNTDNLLISVDGMVVTIENATAEDLLGIDVYCRNVINEQYFGGIAYKYTIETISVGECATITATDAILGMVDVVRVDVNHQN